MRGGLSAYFPLSKGRQGGAVPAASAAAASAAAASAATKSPKPRQALQIALPGSPGPRAQVPGPSVGAPRDPGPGPTQEAGAHLTCAVMQQVAVPVVAGPCPCKWSARARAHEDAMRARKRPSASRATCHGNASAVPRRMRAQQRLVLHARPRAASSESSQAGQPGPSPRPSRD